MTGSFPGSPHPQLSHIIFWFEIKLHKDTKTIEGTALPAGHDSLQFLFKYEVSIFTVYSEKVKPNDNIMVGILMERMVLLYKKRENGS